MDYIRAGDAPTERKSLEDYVRKVQEEAERLQRRYALKGDVNDLAQAGLRGFLEARERFDPKRGGDLWGWARIRVRGAMWDQIREMGYLPRRLHAALRAESRAREEAEREGGAVVANEAADVADIARYAHILASEMALAFALEATDEDESPENQLLAAERAECVQAALSDLSEREREIVRFSYFENVPFAEIAGRLGITPQRCAQLHATAKRKLRLRLGADES